MGLLSWIIFGALAGWVASIIIGNSGRQGCLGNVIVGVVGAFLGGMLLNLFNGRGFSFEYSFDWSLNSFLVAVVGAVLLLVITGARRR